MRRSVLFVVAAVMMGGMAYGRTLSRQETDSVASALATVWGEYMNRKAVKDGDAVSAEYMRGVQEAIKMAGDNDAYFQGLSEGVTIAARIRQIEQMGRFKVDLEKFAYKLQRATDGKNTGFTTATADAYMNRLVADAMNEAHIVEGSAAYLEEVSKREGVVKTPFGLLFEIITEGEGEKPGPDDLIKVNYTGSFINGEVFNASRPGEPMVGAVSGMIPGFSEGLQMMKKGGRYRLYIPSEIGYGSAGVPGVIPAGAATIFEVELVDLRHAEDIAVPAENNENQ